MPDNKTRSHVCVLGGTSRVWRAVAPYWSTKTSESIKTTVCARKAAPGIDLVFSSLDEAMSVGQYDVVLALWGVTSGDENALAQNTQLVLDAQTLARSLGANRVLHAMSGAVYAPASDVLTEQAVLSPRHAYGHAKLAAERALRDQRPTPILMRLGNVVGTDGLAAAVRSGRPMVLDQFDDGTTPHRSYIAPDDLADVFADLARRAVQDLPGILNVAGPAPVSMAALLDAAGISYETQDAPPNALPMQHLDVSRLAALGIRTNKSSDAAHLARFLKQA